MTLRRAQNPFRFSTQVNLIELTEWQAHDLTELLTYLRRAPGSMFYFHTHHFLKQHQFLSPEPPNDFAYWVTHVLQEDKLGEQLAAIDSVRFPASWKNRWWRAPIEDEPQKYDGRENECSLF